MRKLIKLLIAGLAMTFVLSLAASPATARVRLEINATEILAHGRLTFSEREGASVICDVTLHITTLTRLINKIRGSLVGRVTSILTANPRPIGSRCAGLLPLLVLFESIHGTLPNVTGVLLSVRGGFLIGNVFTGQGCLYEGTILAESRENPARRATVRSNVGEIRLARRLEGSCPAEGSMSGTMTYLPEVTIRLLER